MTFETDKMKTVGYTFAELNDSIEQFQQAVYDSFNLGKFYAREPKPLNYHVDLYLEHARALDKICERVFGHLVRELDMPLMGEFYD